MYKVSQETFWNQNHPNVIICTCLNDSCRHWLTRIELNWITFLIKAVDVVLSQKLFSESPWQENGNIIYYIYSLTSPKRVFGQQNTNWSHYQLHNVTIAIIYQRALLVQFSTLYNVKKLRFKRWRERWVWCIPPRSLSCTESQAVQRAISFVIKQRIRKFQLTKSFNWIKRFKLAVYQKYDLGKKKQLYLGRNFFILQ